MSQMAFFWFVDILSVSRDHLISTHKNHDFYFCNRWLWLKINPVNIKINPVNINPTLIIYQANINPTLKIGKVIFLSLFYYFRPFCTACTGSGQQCTGSGSLPFNFQTPVRIELAPTLMIGQININSTFITAKANINPTLMIGQTNINPTFITAKANINPTL